MGRFSLSVILFSICITVATGQLVLENPEYSVTVMDFKTFPNHPVHDASIQSTDSEYEKLFKSYFNPISFENYKSFFLSADWGGFSVQEFNDWQSRIKKDKLYLHSALRVKSEDGREFIICRYSMESSSYSIPESVKFKKVQNDWKHIHVRHDEHFRLLNSIGSLKADIIEAALDQKNTQIQIDQVQAVDKMSIVEKFDRALLFRKIESILKEDGLTDAEIEIARDYFLQKDDQAFAEWVTGISGKPDLEFMEMLNDTTGIKLFNFTKAQNN